MAELPPRCDAARRILDGFPCEIEVLTIRRVALVTMVGAGTIEPGPATPQIARLTKRLRQLELLRSAAITSNIQAALVGSLVDRRSGSITRQSISEDFERLPIATKWDLVRTLLAVSIDPGFGASERVHLKHLIVTDLDGEQDPVVAVGKRAPARGKVYRGADGKFIAAVNTVPDHAEPVT